MPIFLILPLELLNQFIIQSFFILQNTKTLKSPRIHLYNSSDTLYSHSTIICQAVQHHAAVHMLGKFLDCVSQISLLQKKSAVQNGALLTPGRRMDPLEPNVYFKHQFHSRPQSVFMCFVQCQNKIRLFPNTILRDWFV